MTVAEYLVPSGMAEKLCREREKAERARERFAWLWMMHGRKVFEQ